MVVDVWISTTYEFYFVWETGEMQCFGGETRVRDYLKYLVLHGRIILKWMFGNGDGAWIG
jgi:hypothetical protein